MLRIKTPSKNRGHVITEQNMYKLKYLVYVMPSGSYVQGYKKKLPESTLHLCFFPRARNGEYSKVKLKKWKQMRRFLFVLSNPTGLL